MDTQRTAEEMVRLVWPMACISSRAHGTMQGVWSDSSPMADFLGKSWEEVATYDRVIAAAHVTDTFMGAPCSLPPWTSSLEVNKALSEESERIADGEVNWHHAPNLQRAELAEKLLKYEVEVRTHWESKYAKEVMLHAVTKFELKQARDLLREFYHVGNYLQAWIEHTIPTWSPEVQRGLEELRIACDKAMPLRQPLPDKEGKP